MVDARPVLPGITAPVLLIYGDKDASFAPDIVEETARLIPDCTLIRYPRRGHGGAAWDEQTPSHILDFITAGPEGRLVATSIGSPAATRQVAVGDLRGGMLVSLLSRQCSLLARRFGRSTTDAMRREIRAEYRALVPGPPDLGGRRNPDFSGKVAFVTGGSAGMGAATVRAFAEAGAAVAIVDLDGAAAERLAAKLNDRGCRALGIACDVSDEDQVERAVARTVAAFGSLDMAFNNAGIMLPPVDSADETAAAFDRIVAVNLRGVWASMKHELKQMREQGSGSIVNCSSLGGLVGGNGRATCHATKHGVIGQTKSVALQYGRYGVRVNAVCPGTIATPMVERMTAAGELDPETVAAGVPLGRLGRPEEIAAAVLWLASDAASHVTGVALPVDAGHTAQ